MAKYKNTSAANLGFEATLWAAAGKFINNVDGFPIYYHKGSITTECYYKYIYSW